MPHAGTISREMRDCARLCHECKDACLELIPHCLQRGDDHAEADHILLLLDCAQICNTTEEFMHRGSEHHALTCGVCARICDACAEDCEQFGDDDEMRRCAEVCRRCAESCRRMAQDGNTR